MNRTEVLKYVQHTSECDHWTREYCLGIDVGPMPCTCKIDEALALLSAPADPGDIEGEARKRYPDGPKLDQGHARRIFIEGAKYMLSVSATAVQVQQGEGGDASEDGGPRDPRVPSSLRSDPASQAVPPAIAPTHKPGMPWETKGLFFYSDGDPTVGDMGRQFVVEPDIEGKILFEDTTELQQFGDGLADFFGGFYAEKFRWMTHEQCAENERDPY